MLNKTICPYDCPTSCALLAEIEDGRLLGVRADPENPTGGFICNKMRHYERSVYSPGRILRPLRRAGAKGEGKFVPIPWDEAVGEIARRWKDLLAQDGPDAILPMYFSGVMGRIQGHCGDAFWNRMGACALVRTLCSSAKEAGYAAVMGKTGCLDPRELTDSDFYLVWGSDMKATRIQSLPVLAEARRSGKRVVLVEVCAVDMAPYCDQIILLRPGSDGALALALMHVLAREGLVDEDFLRQNAVGWDAFRDTLGAYPPAWAEAVTGVSAADIEALAREFAAAKAPAIILGSGPSRHGNGGMSTRLVTILSALTGAWGRPGGGLCGCDHGAGPFVDKARISRPDFRKAPGRTVNINQIAAALNDRERPIRSFYVYGGNPVCSVSDQNRMVAGLRRDDLFTVVHERFLTDTARYADIILPATFSVEQANCYAAYGYRTFGAARALVPPAGECKSNWETFALLARAMGYDEPYWARGEEAVLDDLLDDPAPALAALSGADRAVLRTGGTVSLPFANHTDWGTEDGKFHIVNPALAEPLPRYTENHGGDYPLRLVAVPSVHTLNSIFLESPEALARRGPATLLLHPADAQARGVGDGDAITAYNDLGEAGFIARVTPLVARGAAAAAGVFPMARTPGGASVNALCHPRLSDLGAATTMNDNTIEVRKGGLWG